MFRRLGLLTIHSSQRQESFQISQTVKSDFKQHPSCLQQVLYISPQFLLESKETTATAPIRRSTMCVRFLCTVSIFLLDYYGVTGMCIGRFRRNGTDIVDLLESKETTATAPIRRSTMCVRFLCTVSIFLLDYYDVTGMCIGRFRRNGTDIVDLLESKETTATAPIRRSTMSVPFLVNLPIHIPVTP